MNNSLRPQGWWRVITAFDKRLVDTHLWDVFRDTSLGFILRIAGAGLAFGANWLLARQLGASGVGVYYLAFTTITVAAVLSRLGLSETCVRFAAPAVAQGDWGAVFGVRHAAWRLVLIASLTITTVIMVSAPLVSRYVFHTPDLTNTLRVIVIALVPFSLLNIDGAMLQSTRHVPASTFIRATAIPGAFFILLLVSGLFVRSPAIAAACYMSAVVIVFIGGVVFWTSTTKAVYRSASYFNNNRLLTTGLRIMGVNSISLVMTWVDTVCVGIWQSSKEVGLYGIAMRVALLTSFIVAAVNSAVGPKFAEFGAQKNTAALRVLTQRTSLGMLIVVLPVSIILVAFPKFVLGLFGPDFTGAATVLIILTIGQFVSVVTGALGHLLMMTGNERLLRNVLAVSAILNLILNVILVPIYGIVGAAVSTAISLITMSLLCVVFVRKKLTIWSVPKW